MLLFYLSRVLNMSKSTDEAGTKAQSDFILFLRRSLLVTDKLQFHSYAWPTYRRNDLWSQHRPRI